MVRDVVNALWPLSETYEYAAEVGLGLRGAAPGWWAEFEHSEDLSLYPLPQAQGFAFMRFIEDREHEGEVARQDVIAVLAGLLTRAQPHMRLEAQASVESFRRSASSDGAEPFPPATLSGQPVDLYAPTACAGQPAGQTAYLDSWTETALDGARVRRCDSEPVAVEDLARVHSRTYIEGLMEFARAGGGLLTPETAVTAESPAAVRAGAGAVCAAVDAALARRTQGVSLCASRPGSHHAARGRGGGTCLVNNLAVAAEHALRGRARRVAIVDIDAHHGNGTEDCFREDPRVFTLSVHQQEPFFPGTGHADELGFGQGRGTNLNLPVAPTDDWAGTLERGLVSVQMHRPDLVLIEYSTDAHRADPVSDLKVDDQDFERAVRMIEGLGVPTVYELGASLSERAWVGGLRALVAGAALSAA